MFGRYSSGAAEGAIAGKPAPTLKCIPRVGAGLPAMRPSKTPKAPSPATAQPSRLATAHFEECPCPRPA
ncbi:hypothetical protein FPT15_00485 [Pseudomonas sp. RGB]|nr:hypothetical protein FPT15_00485 [Pseudomonas sp. RGB]